MLYSKLNSSLHVLWIRGVDTNDGHAPLVAWYTERRVEEAGVDGTIFKHVCLEVGCFHSSRLIGVPVSIAPYLSEGGTIARWRIHGITRSGSRAWIEKWM